MEAPQDDFAGKNLQTYKLLVSEIKEEWSAFLKDRASNLVQSMKNRIFDVITNKGDFIMY